MMTVEGCGCMYDGCWYMIGCLSPIPGNKQCHSRPQSVMANNNYVFYIIIMFILCSAISRAFVALTTRHTYDMQQINLLCWFKSKNNKLQNKYIKEVDSDVKHKINYSIKTNKN